MPFTIKFGRTRTLFICPTSIPRVHYDLMSLKQLGGVLKGGYAYLLNLKIHIRIILHARTEQTIISLSRSKFSCVPLLLA